MIQLTKQQMNAVDLIEDFLRSGRQLFCLQGFAGCGKTTILTYLAEMHPDARLCAPTGKAASVLARKSGRHASTIHALFYKKVGEVVNPKTKKLEPVFEPIHPNGSLTGVLVLADESSMVSVEMAADLMASGATIVTCGDPAQLPPVKGRQAFSQADFLLTEVHRQALESPIVRQATAVRQTGRYAADGDDFRRVKRISDADLIAADVVLCWKNATRSSLNQRIRALHGYRGCPRRGEKIMCLKNAKHHDLYNGETYVLAEDVPYRNAKIALIRADGGIVDVFGCEFVDHGETIQHVQENAVSGFDFGYCLTTHKSQASEWSSVAMIDECHGDIRTPLLYTGITRAADRIVMQG